MNEKNIELEKFILYLDVMSDSKFRKKELCYHYMDFSGLEDPDENINWFEPSPDPYCAAEYMTREYTGVEMYYQDIIGEKLARDGWTKEQVIDMLRDISYRNRSKAKMKELGFFVRVYLRLYIWFDIFSGKVNSWMYK